MKQLLFPQLLFGIVLMATPASGKIGWTLDESKKAYGPIRETYGLQSKTHFPDYVFTKDGLEITVTIDDGRVAQIGLSPKQPYTEMEVQKCLKRFSTSKDWRDTPHTDKVTTRRFPAFLAHPTHGYYKTKNESLFAMTKKDWVGERPFL